MLVDVCQQTFQIVFELLQQLAFRRLVDLIIVFDHFHFTLDHARKSLLFNMFLSLQAVLETLEDKRLLLLQGGGLGFGLQPLQLFTQIVHVLLGVIFQVFKGGSQVVIHHFLSQSKIFFVLKFQTFQLLFEGHLLLWSEFLRLFLFRFFQKSNLI